MERQRRGRGVKALVGLAASFAITALVPAAAMAQGNAVNDLLRGILSSGGGSPQPAAGSPPNYTPPMHGGNPHGQGSIGVIDLQPTNALPLPGTFPNGQEEVTVGDSRGEQNGSTYQGRVTILHANVLGLIDTETLFPGLFTRRTNPGQTDNGPAGPINAALNTVCGTLGQPAGCVSVLAMNSSTSTSGSQNSYSTVGTDLNIPLPPPLGPIGLDTGVAQSSGNISDNGSCQTATGTSNTASANVSVPVVPITPITAGVLQGSSSSQACNNGNQSQSNSSTVANIQGMGLALPAAGCANGTADTSFTALLPLIGTVCNADDSTSGQTTSPYGVREALTVFALVVGGDPLVKVATAGPESHAVAPPAAPAAPGSPDDGGGRRGESGPGGEEGPGGPVSTTAQAGGELAFTGVNVLVLALIGGALMVGGVAIARASTRRHSRATA